MSLAAADPCSVQSLSPFLGPPAQAQVDKLLLLHHPFHALPAADTSPSLSSPAQSPPHQPTTVNPRGAPIVGSGWSTSATESQESFRKPFIFRKTSSSDGLLLPRVPEQLGEPPRKPHVHKASTASATSHPSYECSLGGTQGAVHRNSSPPSTPQPSKQACRPRPDTAAPQEPSSTAGGAGISIVSSKGRVASQLSTSPPFMPSTPTIHRQPSPLHFLALQADAFPCQPRQHESVTDVASHAHRAGQRRKELFCEPSSSPRQMHPYKGIICELQFDEGGQLMDQEQVFGSRASLGWHRGPARKQVSGSRRRLSLRHGSTVGEMCQYVRYLADATWRRERDMGLGGWSQYSVGFDDVFSVISELGQGHFGMVRLCVEKETGLKFACKTIPKAKIQKEEDAEELLAEVTTMLKIQSQPNIDSSRFVKLHEILNGVEHIYLVMEYCDGGDLFEFLASSKRLSETETAQVLREVVKAVQDLHSMGIVHRDLKLENILLCSTPSHVLHQKSPNTALEKTPRWQAKIADFGLCLELSDGQLAKGAAGSPFYMAPEVVGRRLSGKEVDVWSLGVVLYTCLCGYLPFWGKDKSAVFTSVLAAAPNLEKKPWPAISDDAKDLIRGMLNAGPCQRLSLDDVLAHPWCKKL